MDTRQLEELVIELADQRERAKEGSELYREADEALDRLCKLHPQLVPHMLEEYWSNQGYEA